MKHSFKITIEPLDDKSGDVDLDVCIQQLSSLEKAIRKTAKKISNKNPVKLKLVQASKNSPFNATIEMNCSGRKVCVSGRAIYNKNQNFPYLIEVKNIDLYTPESELPDWKDLLGIAPEATGSLLSEEFIRNLRNEWQ